MTATDELRRLLDERGVEYTVVPENAYTREYIKIGNIEILTNDRDEVAVYYLTPEQAVEATLGRGTCRDTGEDDVRIDELNAENAKLRELVLDYEELTAKLCDSRECDGCPFDTESTMCKHMHMLLRVGELGVDA